MQKREYNEFHYYPAPALLSHGLVGVPLFENVEDMKQLLRDYYAITEDFYELSGNINFTIEYENGGEVEETTGFLTVEADIFICFDNFSVYAFAKFIKAFLQRFPSTKYLATSVVDLHSKPLDLSLDLGGMMDLIGDYKFDEADEE
ncbi:MULTISPECIES: hypothetical protein [unclassified Pseudovibrio]|uniref:hypothetical protein n=1 Tax=unclassified Pseudovibrio TaxID=2627060 RepID=UPI0007AE9883|nr:MULTISPECIES: hypothetical protein [unclassified Pseudovibrio]KZK95252.1 hypothetical protein PsW74_04036 [Pseudovibrio sp. W74]KZL10422.1 hypothetical protein PsAD14_01329 [Pseudovibrio sp. Ad14]